MRDRLMTGIPITREGKQALEEQLAHLTQVRYPQVMEWIKSAHQAPPGDLADAAQLRDAQLEQIMLEARIAELKLILDEAQVLDHPESHDRVEIGSSVTVRDEEGVDHFRIVAPVEAAPRQGRVSFESPVGGAILGHRAGELVSVLTPQGERRLKIVKVE